MRGAIFIYTFCFHEGGGCIEGLNDRTRRENWSADPISGSAFLIENIQKRKDL